MTYSTRLHQQRRLNSIDSSDLIVIMAEQDSAVSNPLIVSSSLGTVIEGVCFLTTGGQEDRLNYLKAQQLFSWPRIHSVPYSQG